MKEQNRWIEHTKSISLVTLVLLSFVLTGYLWYSAPSYEENRKEDYFQPPFIGKEEENDKRPYQLTNPFQIIAHRASQHLLILSNKTEFNDLYHTIRTTSLTEFTWFQPKYDDWNLFYNQSQGMELQFPYDNSIGQLDNFFQQTTLRDEPLLNSLGTISRILLFTDPQTKQVWVWFVQDNGQKVIRARVDNFTNTKINHIMTQINPSTHTALTPIPTNGKPPWDEANKDIPFSRMLYLPIKPLPVSQLTYHYKTIDINTMKQWLFKDPFVTPIQINDDELLYMYNGQDQNIDSDQIITYHQRKASMIYSSTPTTTDEPKMLIREELNQMNQFIQQHRGWTGNYVLEQITSENTANEYFFRLFVDGHPIYWSHEGLGSDLSSIQFQISNNSVSKYARSMHYLTGDPVKKTDVFIPKSEDILLALQNNGIPLNQVTQIYPSYQGSMPKGEKKQINLQPTWIVYTLDGKVRPLSSKGKRG